MMTDKMRAEIGRERYAIHRSRAAADRALAVFAAMLQGGAAVLTDGGEVRLAGPVEVPLENLLAGLRILARKGASLRRRYEAQCSYPWANTDAYLARTERQENAARDLAERLGLCVDFQHDPRGPALHVAADANLSHTAPLA
jgi:hypothetical protein